MLKYMNRNYTTEINCTANITVLNLIDFLIKLEIYLYFCFLKLDQFLLRSSHPYQSVLSKYYRNNRHLIKFEKNRKKYAIHRVILSQ